MSITFTIAYENVFGKDLGRPYCRGMSQRLKPGGATECLRSSADSLRGEE
jgi:hypothetical protein